MDLLNPLTVARAKYLFAEKKMFAKCMATDSVGDCVFIRADVDPSGVIRVGKAIPTSVIRMPAVGIILEKSSSSDCIIQWVGEIIQSGLSFGKSVFVGLDGKLTQDTSVLVPSVGGIVYVQNMGVTLTSETLLLLPNFSMIKRVG